MRTRVALDGERRIVESILSLLKRGKRVVGDGRHVELNVDDVENVEQARAARARLIPRCLPLLAPSLIHSSPPASWAHIINTAM